MKLWQDVRYVGETLLIPQNVSFMSNFFLIGQHVLAYIKNWNISMTSQFLILWKH